METMRNIEKIYEINKIIFLSNTGYYREEKAKDISDFDEFLNWLNSDEIASDFNSYSVKKHKGYKSRSDEITLIENLKIIKIRFQRNKHHIEIE